MTSRTGCAVARWPALVMAALVALACPSPMATLSVSAGTLRVGGEAAVTVSAFTGEQPGSGAVELSTSLGELGATSVALADGAGRTTLRCPRATAGCVAGASITLTARWSSPQGVLTETATVRVFDGSAGDGGGVDGGGVDGGGVDGGALDAGPVEGLLLFDGGTPLPQDRALIIGRLGPPRTLGFSELSTGAPVRLGFNELPSQALLYAGRLVYVRRGVLAAWAEDFADAGVPQPDGGEVDGGELDGGSADAGGPDGGSMDSGVSFGPFPLFNPEGNDPVIATCAGVFGTPDAGALRMVLPTPAGGLWLGCSETPAGPLRLLFKENRFLLLEPTQNITPLAAEEKAVLGLAAPVDGGGGVVVVSQNVFALVQLRTPRRVVVRTATRAVVGGFEFLEYDTATGRCWWSRVSDLGGYEDTALPEEMDSELCQGARFDGRRNAVLVVSRVVLDAGLEPVVLEVPLSRPVDGGSRDAGVRDAGTPTVDRIVRLRAGPPSNFTATPPTLSVDLESLVLDGGRWVVTQ